MIITQNTGTSKDTSSFCKCGSDYGGDRIELIDDVLTPILDGEHQCGLDLSGFFKNVSQANIINFKLAVGQSKILTSPDGNGMKFLAIKTEKPTSILYWRKKYEDAWDEFVTAILHGSFKIVASPFTSDRINASLELTLNSDNLFKYIVWSNIGSAYVNGVYADTWANASFSWNSYDPLVTTNKKLVVEDNVVTVPFVIEQDDLGNYTGEVTEIIQLGTSALTFTLKFHGEYPNTFIIDSITLALDGHLVGNLFVDIETSTVDFITTPLSMEANCTFIAASGLVEVYDKLVGLMILTSTDNEPISDIKVLNKGVELVKVSAMIGT